jgi:hypothetical protein
MLTPKDESIDNWLMFFKQVSFGYVLFFYTLDVGIAFGKQNDLT